MARTVKDAASILSIIAGVDSKDEYTSCIPDNGHIPDYVAACNMDALKGARIGVPRNVIAACIDPDKSWTEHRPEVNEPILTAFEEAIQKLKDAGAIIVDPVNFEDPMGWWEENPEGKLNAAEFKAILPKFLAEHLETNPHNITDLESLRKFTQTDKREEYPDRDTLTWDRALSKEAFDRDSPEFKEKLQKSLEWTERGGVIGTIKRGNLDALVMPSSMTDPWAGTAGTPIISVPLGFYPKDAQVVMNNPGQDTVDSGPGVPFGVAFMGDRWTESKLIGLGYAFEQITMARKMGKPVITPESELENVVGTK